MISKKVISNILSKYFLGGYIERVIWEIEDKKLHINFMNDSESLSGYVEYRDDIGLKNGKYNIFATSKLIKCVNILDGDILLSASSNNSKLNLADTNYEISFSLGLDGTVNQADINKDDDEGWSVSFSISDEFITRFVKSKDALGDLSEFTFSTREGFTGKELVITMGDKEEGDSIEFTVENPVINEDLEYIPFNSDLLKEILKSNKDYHSGEIRIDKYGLMDIHLHCGGPLYTGYYLPQIENNN